MIRVVTNQYRRKKGKMMSIGVTAAHYIKLQCYRLDSIGDSELKEIYGGVISNLGCERAFNDTIPVYGASVEIWAVPIIRNWGEIILIQIDDPAFNSSLNDMLIDEGLTDFEIELVEKFSSVT